MWPQAEYWALSYSTILVYFTKMNLYSPIPTKRLWEALECIIIDRPQLRTARKIVYTSLHITITVTNSTYTITGQLLLQTAGLVSFVLFHRSKPRKSGVDLKVCVAEQGLTNNIWPFYVSQTAHSVSADSILEGHCTLPPPPQMHTAQFVFIIFYFYHTSSSSIHLAI
jgi:hypothetical protein